MALITDLPSTSSLNDTDVLVVDTGTSTKQIAVSDFRSALPVLRMYTFQLASGTAKTLTVPSNSRHFLVVAGTAASRHGVFVVNASSNGTLYVLDVAEGTNLSYTTGTNSMSITSAGGAGTVMVISFYGSSITG